MQQTRRQLKLRFGGLRKNSGRPLEIRLGIGETSLRFGLRSILAKLLKGRAVGGRQVAARCRKADSP